MREYLVSGVPLRDPLGEWFIDYTRSTLFSDVSRTITSDSPYGYHGDVVSQEGYFGSARESVVLNITGATQAAFEQNLRGFQGLFARPEYLVVSAPQKSALAGGTARFGQTFSASADLQRRSTFRMVGSMAIERIDAAACRATIILENRLAFWRTPNFYTTVAAAINAVAQTVSLNTVAADSTAPLTEGTLRIKGPLALNGAVLVRDRDAPRAVRYTAVTALAATEYVLVDLASLKARLVTTDTWDMTAGTDVSSRLDVTGDGPMHFTPGDPKAFPAEAFAYAATLASTGYSAGTAIEIRVKRSYLS